MISRHVLESEDILLDIEPSREDLDTPCPALATVYSKFALIVDISSQPTLAARSGASSKNQQVVVFKQYFWDLLT